MATSFTLWVRDENPDKTFLIALLLRVCKEQPGLVPEEFQHYAQGHLDRRYELSYRASRNYTKGGCDVVFTLTYIPYEPVSVKPDGERVAKQKELDALRSTEQIESNIANLKRGDAQVRVGAVEQLGEMRDLRAVQPLVEALKDGDSAVRSAAAWALGKIGDPSAIDALNCALADPEEKVRRETSAALNRIKETRSVQRISEARENRQQSERKWWQVWK